MYSFRFFLFQAKLMFPLQFNFSYFTPFYINFKKAVTSGSVLACKVAYMF